MLLALEYYTPKDASSLQPPVVSMIYNNKYIPIYIYQQEKYRVYIWWIVVDGVVLSIG